MTRGQDLTGMAIEGDDDRSESPLPAHLHNPPDDCLLATVDAVEESDSDSGFAVQREGPDPMADIHPAERTESRKGSLSRGPIERELLALGAAPSPPTGVGQHGSDKEQAHGQE